MMQGLKTPLVLAFAWMVVVVLGCVYSWPADGLDGLRIISRNQPQPAQVCGKPCPSSTPTPVNH